MEAGINGRRDMKADTYREGEALTGYMTAAQWLNRFDAITMAFVEDQTKAVKEMERAARKVAKFLRLPVAESGMYAPIVFELAYLREFPTGW